MDERCAHRRVYVVVRTAMDADCLDPPRLSHLRSDNRLCASRLSVLDGDGPEVESSGAVAGKQNVPAVRRPHRAKVDAGSLDDLRLARSIGSKDVHAAVLWIC